DVDRKEWQLRCKDDPSIEVTMSNIEYDNNSNHTYRTIIDTGSTTTTVPYYLRKKMSNGRFGWSTHFFLATGYGAGTKMNRVSKRWEICIGDGKQPKDPENSYLIIVKHGAIVSESVNCSRIGIDVLKEGGSAVDAAIATELCVGTINALC
ncbi:38519_t:CDS:2, partial [Gigaspora margarita]